MKGKQFPTIIYERFLRMGTVIREVNLEVQPYLDSETSDQAAVRLVADGFVLEGIAELEAFDDQHHEQVQKWAGRVFAIAEESRWADPDDVVYVTLACVDGPRRYFSLRDFHFHRLYSRHGILVSRPASSK